jgi:hypothetical protein
MNYFKTIFILGLAFSSNTYQVAAKSSKSEKNETESKSGKGTVMNSAANDAAGISGGKSEKVMTTGAPGMSMMGKAGKSTTILDSSISMSMMGKSGKSAAISFEMSMGKSSKTMSLMINGDETHLRGGKTKKRSKST